MKDYIKKRLRDVKRKKTACKKDNSFANFLNLTSGIVWTGLGALSIVANPLLGVGSIIAGGSMLYSYKNGKDKEKNMMKALQSEEDNLNKMSRDGGVPIDDASKSRRKTALDDANEDYQDALADYKRSSELSNTFDWGFTFSLIPFILFGGPVSLSVMGGCAIGKLLANKKAKDDKIKVDSLNSKVDSLKDETKVAGLVAPTTQSQQQTQGQQSQNTNGNSRTRNNTRNNQNQQQTNQTQNQQQTNQTQNQQQANQTQNQHQTNQTQRQQQANQTQNQQRQTPRRNNGSRGNSRNNQQHTPIVTPITTGRQRNNQNPYNNITGFGNTRRPVVTPITGSDQDSFVIPDIGALQEPITPVDNSRNLRNNFHVVNNDANRINYEDLIKRYIKGLDGADEFSMLRSEFSFRKNLLEKQAEDKVKELENYYRVNGLNIGHFYAEAAKIYSKLDKAVAELQYEYFRAVRQLQLSPKSKQFSRSA